MLIELRSCDEQVGHQGGEQEDNRGHEAEEATHHCTGSQSKEDDIASTGEDSTHSLASEHSSHVLRRKLASNTQDSSLEDGSVGVDEGDRDEGEGHELLLPGVSVHPDHDGGEGEADDDHDEADNETRLSFKLVTEDSVENEEGDVGNHGSHGEVTIPSILQLVRTRR